MRLEDIAPGWLLEGLAQGCQATVLCARPMGPGAVAVVYRDPLGNLAERLMGRADEPFLRVAVRHRAWAFDVDGEAFKRALGASRRHCEGPVHPGRPGPGQGELDEAMHAAMLLRQGAFLVDPAGKGLVPYLLLVVAHRVASPDGSSTRGRIVLVQAQASGEMTLAGERAEDSLVASSPMDRARLTDALRPLLADAGLRSRAVDWVASGLAGGSEVARASDPAVPGDLAPGQGWVFTPPFLLGGAVVFPEALPRWLQQRDPAARGIPAARPPGPGQTPWAT